MMFGASFSVRMAYWLASGSDDHTVRIWNPATGACLQTLEGHTQAVNDLAFSPDGKTLLSAGNDGFVQFWNLTSGRSVRTIKTHPDGIVAIAVSPDGTTLATSGFDRVMKLWDLSSGRGTEHHQAAYRESQRNGLQPRWQATRLRKPG